MHGGPCPETVSRVPRVTSVRPARRDLCLWNPQAMTWLRWGLTALALMLSLGGCGGTQDEVARDLRKDLDAYWAAMRGVGPLPSDAHRLYEAAYAARAVEPAYEELRGTVSVRVPQDAH